MPEANDASEQVEVEEFSCTPVTQVECVIGGQKRTFATERDAKLAFTRVKYEARAAAYCDRNSIDGKVKAARVNVVADFLADEELDAEEA